MDVVVAAEAVGGSGYFWAHYLTPGAAAGAAPEVVGAEVGSVVEVSAEVAADSAVALVAAAALAAAAPEEAGRRVLFGTPEFC